MIYYCALSFSPCLPSSDWISLWSSFGGVLVAFALGAVSQKYSDRRTDKKTFGLLERTLSKGLEALAPFDVEWRPIKMDENERARGFGALSQIAAATNYALAHPEGFPPAFFLKLIMVSDRLIAGGKTGPAVTSVNEV